MRGVAVNTGLWRSLLRGEETLPGFVNARGGIRSPASCRDEYGEYDDKR